VNIYDPRTGNPDGTGRSIVTCNGVQNEICIGDVDPAALAVAAKKFGEFLESTYRKGLEILHRVGGGDSFASGLIYGYLSGKDAKWAVECGAAHAALAMTTPGDTSMATLNEVLRLMQDTGARIAR
jgi:fructose-1-phosphate kinase PfkB-like protein